MRPHELVNRLVEDAGGSFRVARAMHRPSFQGTLHKFCKDKVDSPTRSTAERIAKHFGISIDALYSERAATDEANRLWPAEAHQAPPPAPAPAFPWPLAPYITPEQWAELSEPLRHAAALGAAEGLRKARDLLPSSEKRQANDK